MNIICTICARGGSKGVPNKNIREVLGKPLIAYTIAQAQEAGIFSAIAVSSDSPQILDAGRDNGATHAVVRPAEYADDYSAKHPAIRHCVETVEAETGTRFDIIVDMDCTSPLRHAADIRGAVDMHRAEGGANIITGSSARRIPYFNLVERTERGNIALSKHADPPYLRRQDCPECYDMNASIYVWDRNRFMDEPKTFNDDTQIYVMPPERSIDIDSEFDFEIVEYLMKKQAAEGE